MIVKIGGVGEACNIAGIISSSADIVGLDFRSGAPNHIRMVSSGSGLMPDSVRKFFSLGAGQACRGAGQKWPALCGEFEDSMFQDIVTRIYVYKLSSVQLCGGESPVMVENLKRTVDPDIRPGLKVLKTLCVSSRADLAKCRDYCGIVDMFVFNLGSAFNVHTGSLPLESLFSAYDVPVPFLLGGEAAIDGWQRLGGIGHGMFAGIDVACSCENQWTGKSAEDIGAFVRSAKNVGANKQFVK